MTHLFLRTLGALALAALVAVPATAADAPADTAATAAASVSRTGGETAATTSQDESRCGPGHGRGCVLPPDQQRDPCICPLLFDPVCGCNGETYSNACFASCEVRRWEEGAC